MGIDFLDLNFRVEKRFGVQLHVADFPPEILHNNALLTAGLYSDTVQRKINARLRGTGQPEAGDVWPQVRDLIAATVQMDPHEITPESRLIQDLGYT